MFGLFTNNKHENALVEFQKLLAMTHYDSKALQAVLDALSEPGAFYKIAILGHKLIQRAAAVQNLLTVQKLLEYARLSANEKNAILSESYNGREINTFILQYFIEQPDEVIPFQKLNFIVDITDDSDKNAHAARSKAYTAFKAAAPQLFTAKLLEKLGQLTAHQLKALEDLFGNQSVKQAFCLAFLEYAVDATDFCANPNPAQCMGYAFILTNANNIGDVPAPTIKFTDEGKYYTAASQVKTFVINALVNKNIITAEANEQVISAIATLIQHGKLPSEALEKARDPAGNTLWAKVAILGNSALIIALGHRMSLSVTINAKPGPLQEIISGNESKLLIQVVEPDTDAFYHLCADMLTIDPEQADNIIAGTFIISYGASTRVYKFLKFDNETSLRKLCDALILRGIENHPHKEKILNALTNVLLLPKGLRLLHWLAQNKGAESLMRIASALIQCRPSLLFYADNHNQLPVHYLAGEERQRMLYIMASAGEGMDSAAAFAKGEFHMQYNDVRTNHNFNPLSSTEDITVIARGLSSSMRNYHYHVDELCKEFPDAMREAYITNKLPRETMLRVANSDVFNVARTQDENQLNYYTVNKNRVANFRYPGGIGQIPVNELQYAVATFVAGYTKQAADRLEAVMVDYIRQGEGPAFATKHFGPQSTLSLFNYATTHHVLAYIMRKVSTKIDTSSLTSFHTPEEVAAAENFNTLHEITKTTTSPQMALILFKHTLGMLIKLNSSDKRYHLIYSELQAQLCLFAKEIYHSADEAVRLNFINFIVNNKEIASCSVSFRDQVENALMNALGNFRNLAPAELEIFITTRKHWPLETIFNAQRIDTLDEHTDKNGNNILHILCARSNNIPKVIQYIYTRLPWLLIRKNNEGKCPSLHPSKPPHERSGFTRYFERDYFDLLDKNEMIFQLNANQLKLQKFVINLGKNAANKIDFFANNPSAPHWAYAAYVEKMSNNTTQLSGEGSSSSATHQTILIAAPNTNTAPPAYQPPAENSDGHSCSDPTELQARIDDVKGQLSTAPAADKDGFINMKKQLEELLALVDGQLAAIHEHESAHSRGPR